MDDTTKLKRFKAACERGRLDYDEVIALCRDGKAQFHDNPLACAVTTISVSGANKVCYILVMAGALGGFRELLSDVERFARDNECTVLHSITRPGFEAVHGDLIEGAKVVGVMFEKVL